MDAYIYLIDESPDDTYTAMIEDFFNKNLDDTIKKQLNEKR